MPYFFTYYSRMLKLDCGCGMIFNMIAWIDWFIGRKIIWIFFSEEVLYFTNTVSQLVIAISAIVAIMIAIKQTRYNGKANIKGYYKCGLGLIENNDSKELEEFIIDDINDKVSIHGKVYVYAQLCNGKIRKWKTKDAYASFRHEAEKMIRRAKESNCDKVNK